MKKICIEMILVVLLSFFIGVASAAAGTVNYTYDAAGRLIKADYGDKAITYTYDKAGNLLERKVGPSCGYALAPSSVACGSAGGSWSFNVAVTGTGCNWDATNGDSWINITSGSGTGNGKVDYSVSSNGTGQTRQGTISVEGQTFTLKQAKSEFSDIPFGYWAYNFVYALYASGITTGCGNDSYCPDDTVTRAQMAVFVVKALGETPAATCSGMFDDVSEATGDNPAFCKYIEKFSTLGITAGCGGSNFCPGELVTRAQMAVFITKAIGEAAASCTGTVFNDVNGTVMPSAFCGFIEKFSTLGITSGCGGGNYCPNDLVTRAQMAVFLTKGFLQ
jgi:YD repeat-containing protein